MFLGFCILISRYGCLCPMNLNCLSQLFLTKSYGQLSCPPRWLTYLRFFSISSLSYPPIESYKTTRMYSYKIKKGSKTNTQALASFLCRSWQRPGMKHSIRNTDGFSMWSIISRYRVFFYCSALKMKKEERKAKVPELFRLIFPQENS